MFKFRKALFNHHIHELQNKLENTSPIYQKMKRKRLTDQILIVANYFNTQILKRTHFVYNKKCVKLLEQNGCHLNIL